MPPANANQMQMLMLMPCPTSNEAVPENQENQNRIQPHKLHQMQCLDKQAFRPPKLPAHSLGSKDEHKLALYGMQYGERLMGLK